MAFISRFLDTNGDNTGTTNANGDYSSASGEFYIQPPAGEYYDIHRMIVSIGDTKGMSAEEYGNLGAALTNGITLKLLGAGDALITQFTPIPAKSNASWGIFCYDVDVKSWGTSPTDELLVARWTFTKSGRPIRLADNNKLMITCDDDLQGLITHYFLVQGEGGTV